MREVESRKNSPARRKRRRARRKPSKFAYFLLFTAVACCAVVVCSKTVFKVRKIDVSGKSAYKADQVVRACKIDSGASLLGLNKSAVVKNICTSLPFISDAKISVFPPSTVKIAVSADAPQYSIKAGAYYIYADTGLKVLEITKDGKKYRGTVNVNGGALNGCKPGQAVAFKDGTRAAAITNLFAVIKKSGISGITGIDVSNSYQVAVVFDSRINVVLGTELDVDKKLGDAAAIIKSKMQPSDRGSLDVSSQNRRYIFSPS